MTLADFLIMAAVILVFISRNYYKLFHMSFDEEGAKAMGINTEYIGRIFIILIALTVVISMRIVGILLISSMMVIPVASAMQISGSFKGTIMTAVGLAILSMISGITASFYFDIPSGGAIVLISVIILIAIIVFKGRR